MATPVIWTLGHSTHQTATLVSLLRQHDIDVAADIRSQPFSRRNPQFNRENLRSSLREAQIRYVFLGAELGGRPPEPEFYDAEGRVRYEAVARSGRFSEGLGRLLAGAARYCVAILCSEEDPVKCHRRLLVGRALTERGVDVQHIRGDGRVENEQDLAQRAGETSQSALFGSEVTASRSVRPVPPGLRAGRHTGPGTTPCLQLPMPELQLVRPDHAPALLVFERENRAYFAAVVPDRGDEFFTEFGARHAQLLKWQAAGTDYFHVLVAEGGEVVGRVNLTGVADGSAELGYRIAQKAAGRGLATAAVREVRELAAAQYGLARLRARVTLDNPASRKVLERNGFAAVGELTLNGKPATSFICELC